MLFLDSRLKSAGMTKNAELKLKNHPLKDLQGPNKEAKFRDRPNEHPAEERGLYHSSSILDSAARSAIFAV